MPGIKTSHIQGELQYSLTFWIHKTQWNSVPKCAVSSSDWISSVHIDVTLVHFIFSLLKLAVRMTSWNICPRKYLIFDTVACSGDLSTWGDEQSFVWPLRGTQWSPTATVTGAVPHSLVTGRKCSRCHEKQPKTWWPSSPEWASPFRGTGTSLSAAQCPRASGTLQGHTMCCCATGPAWFFPGDLKLISLSTFSCGGERVGRQAA